MSKTSQTVTFDTNEGTPVLRAATAAGSERRIERSDDPRTAVELQLQHVVDVLDLDALVLADDMGFPLAHVGNRRLARLLANAAMWTVGDGVNLDQLTRFELEARFPELGDRAVVSIAVQLPGMESPGRLFGIGRSRARSIGLAHAASGVLRICCGASVRAA